MKSWRKSLAVLGGITAVAVLVNELSPGQRGRFTANSRQGRQPPGPMAPGRGHSPGCHRMGSLPYAICGQNCP